jgi:hypothetical protein
MARHIIERPFSITSHLHCPSESTLPDTRENAAKMGKEEFNFLCSRGLIGRFLIFSPKFNVLQLILNTLGP